MSGFLRKLIAAGLVAVGVSILAFVIFSSENAGNKDFISYWAAGQLLVRHANPYDPAAVFQLEKSVGFREPEPLLMRNPPYALLLALPLGLVGAKTGAVLWSLLLVGAIVISVRLIWTMHGRPPDRLHLFGYLFAPVVACLPLGQTSVFVLLGLVLFLRWHKTRPLTAGACLTLLAIKPHLFLPFGLALLLWVAASVSYKLLLGPVLALSATLVFLLWFDHSLWAHYLPVLKGADAESKFIPTISSLVRLVIDPRAAWVQFVPAMIACVWAFWYFHRHGKEWDWNHHGLLLLPVSILVAPYSWFTDEIIVMPAIMRGIFVIAAKGGSLVSFVLINGAALAGVLFGVALGSGFYIWTSTAWLIWYACATSESGLAKAAGSTE